MYFTEKEIWTQQEALEKTFRYVVEQKAQLGELLRQKKRFIFLGCGSSYMVCKTGRSLFAAKPDTAAAALAGGEYLIHPDFYREMIKDAVLIVLSRSGMTSEVVMAADHIRKTAGIPVVSVTMKAGNDLAALSDIALVCPWAFDESVCQTRTVSNLYEVLLLLSAIYDGGEEQLREIKEAVCGVRSFLEDIAPAVREIAQRDFTDVVVLADGVLCGLAEEAALAFTEIALISGKYFHLLDYRHGPKVLNGSHTLTIAAIHPGARELQQDMLEDLRACGGTVVALCPQGTAADYPSDLTIACPQKQFALQGFSLIAAAQLLAFSKAVEKGVDPDNPRGLSACITLK